jgi:hypothetical protein
VYALLWGAEEFGKVGQGALELAFLASEDVGDARGALKRNGMDGGLHELSKGSRENSDARPGGDHEGDGLGAW